MLERFYLMIYESLQIITTSIKKKKNFFQMLECHHSKMTTMKYRSFFSNKNIIDLSTKIMS